MLHHFVNFNHIDLDLKLHSAQVILCRCFSPTGGITLPDDADWFINGAFVDYHTDFHKPWITTIIKGAIKMIMSDDFAVQGVLGTTFMVGVIEFYAKAKLEWEPVKYDFFDDACHIKYRKMTLGNAVGKIKKMNSALTRSLNKIDKHKIDLLKYFCIDERRYKKARIADRLSLSRNTMLHGEKPFFLRQGQVSRNALFPILLS